MNDDRKISTAVIKRLPRYYRYLGYLKDNDIKKTSSKELSEMMEITASQIRQDLNNFGCFGQQGYGYDVDSLYLEIKKILGINYMHTMVIIGCGNIGQALANYSSFEERGFKIVGIFDKNPKLFGMTIRNIRVYDVEKMPQFLIKNKVDIAILSVPKENAEEVAHVLSNYRIKGIWNFSNVELNLKGSNILIENIQLTDNLMTLSYRINEKTVFDNLNARTSSLPL